MKKKIKKQNGITLIALVITIIVMLILVAVTINMAINGGLFSYAGKAVGETQNAIDDEKQIGTGGIEIDGTWYESIDQYLAINGGIDWEAVLADANANPDKYKHSDQSSTNGDIGIGTDGKPVNMDLWNCTLDGTSISLFGYDYCGDYYPSYSNSDIINGRIQGTVPQYVKKDGSSEFYPVTNMDNTFCGCVSLTTPPKIPDSVTNMSGTFSRM